MNTAPESSTSRWSIVRRQFRKKPVAVWGLWVAVVLGLVAVYAPVIASGHPYFASVGGATGSPWFSRLFDVNYWEHGIDRAFNLSMVVLTAFFLVRGIAWLLLHVPQLRPLGVFTDRLGGVFLRGGLALLLVQLTVGAGGSWIGVFARAGAAGLAVLALTHLLWGSGGTASGHERTVRTRRIVLAVVAVLAVAMKLGLVPADTEDGLASDLGLVTSSAVVDYRKHAASWPQIVERWADAQDLHEAVAGTDPLSPEGKQAAAAWRLAQQKWARALSAWDLTPEDVRDEDLLELSITWPPIPYGHRDQLASMDDQFRRSLDFAKGERHLMGTDQVGRDVFARILYGTRISLTIGILAVSIYATIGTILGALAGYFRGKPDLFIMRAVEIVMCVPPLFLILTILALFDTRSIFMIMIAIGLVSWTGITRLVRGEFLRERNIEYVAAAKVMGFSERRIVFRHVLPNALAPVLVAVPFGVASAILTESTLTFLGLGDITVPSWGRILNDGREFGYWHLIIPPAVAIFITVTALNLVGDGLRDALDPKLRD